MHIPQPPEEILQCFDENKNPTIGRPRSVVKAIPHKYWFGIACIWLINNAGQILCSKRASHLAANPDKWASYFGGHVGVNETFTKTAVKELREEAGVSISEGDLFLIESIAKPEDRVFAERFVVLYNEPTIDLANTDGEVSAVRWMSMEDAWKEQEENPDAWCMPCRPHQQKLIREWLATKINNNSV